MESWMDVSLEWSVEEGEKTHPDHCQEDAYGAKNALGRCDARGLLARFKPRWLRQR